jgi:hypothetical protein
VASAAHQFDYEGALAALPPALSTNWHLSGT